MHSGGVQVGFATLCSCAQQSVPIAGKHCYSAANMVPAHVLPAVERCWYTWSQVMLCCGCAGAGLDRAAVPSP
jgi:hypothetical protein